MDLVKVTQVKFSVLKKLASKNFNSITSYTTGPNPESLRPKAGPVGNSITTGQGGSKEIANQISNTSQAFQLASSTLESSTTFPIQ